MVDSRLACLLLCKMANGMFKAIGSSGDGYVVFVMMKVRVKPEKYREFAQTIAALLEATQAEQSLRNFNICQDIIDKNVFFFIEEWESRSQFTTYLRSPLFNVLLGATKILCMPPGLSVTLFSDRPSPETTQ